MLEFHRNRLKITLKPVFLISVLPINKHITREQSCRISNEGDGEKVPSSTPKTHGPLFRTVK